MSAPQTTDPEPLGGRSRSEAISLIFSAYSNAHMASIMVDNRKSMMMFSHVILASLSLVDILSAAAATRKMCDSIAEYIGANNGDNYQNQKALARLETSRLLLSRCMEIMTSL